MKVSDKSLSAEEVLKKYWNYDSFRPLQRDIIDSILSGNDTLGLMPTGGGKSITFQVPGLMIDGLTVIVSPLISLMKDQVDNLKAIGIKAVAFHSGMSIKETNRAWERLVNNRAQFLYVAPERLRNSRFLSEIRNLPVKLIVVDEAHCISQWGYDFRPDYLRIKELRKIFPFAPVLALTATATPEVTDDICRQLNFGETHRIFKMSFSRDNISYIVRPSESKYSDVCHILSRTSGTAIVYVRSRRKTREIAEYLNNAGISATYYHAGLSYETKEERQNLWRTGQVRVMVATNAFGMGIDKPDVRVVIHFDLPPSLEEYYQEAGRAGRDGLPSFAVLLTSTIDKGNLRRKISLAFPPREDIRRIYELVCVSIGKFAGEGYESISDFDIEKFCTTFKLPPVKVKAALRILGQAGYMDFEEESEHSSRVMMMVNREELYSISGLSKMAETVLTRVLRTYPGLFIDYVMIRENRIATDSGLTMQQVYEGLQELRRHKVLDYVPRRRSPFIYLPTAVEESRYIQIGRSIYEDRQAVYTRRAEAMIDYAYNNDSCRVDRMLRYFGEESRKDCNKCDICRDRKKKRVGGAGRVDVADLLQYIVSHSSGVSPVILERDYAGRTDEVVAALRFLVSEGYVFVKDGIYFADNNSHSK